MERRMARPQGAGILADLRAVDPNCSKVPTSHFHPTVHPPAEVLDLKSEPDIMSDPQVSVISSLFYTGRWQEETPPWESPVLTGDSSASTRLFPVSCLLRWGIAQLFLSKRSRCHQTTLLAAHWPNSAAPVGPALLLLQLSLLFFLLVYEGLLRFQCVAAVGQTVFHEWKEGRYITSLLSATMISSTYFVVFWACLLCWSETQMLQVRNVLLFVLLSTWHSDRSIYFTFSTQVNIIDTQLMYKYNP